jgi:NAD(P)-dependent dehydrogenase (short-subunit alcohol dehydrogenase family)
MGHSFLSAVAAIESVRCVGSAVRAMLHEADFGVEGQSVVVTGASQGIGRTIAETFATAGANVAICSRSQDRVDPVAEEIEMETDSRCLAVECNVRDRDDVEAFFEAVVEEFGGIDTLVNNAGGEFVAAFDDISPKGWNAIVDLNLGGTFHCTQVAGGYMQEGDGGTVINMSSVNGQHAAPSESHYSASKAAIIRLTETLSVEYASEGIRVVCVAPGLIQTPGVAETLGIQSEEMPPREEVDRRIGHTEDIADVVQFLASPAAAFVNGETYTVKGVPRAGNSMSADLGLQ